MEKENGREREREIKDTKNEKKMTYLIPAALAALSPTIESSITTHLMLYCKRECSNRRVLCIMLCYAIVIDHLMLHDMIDQSMILYDMI